ncbi:phospholipase A2 inhibitor gamma subunit B-like [Anolis carolinensis]|uniref:phospholipase A2 inhibitor gamma subunit B-like n=1 Tax=Anolis carolinensis TaxID=28377 RepID=UPI000203998B
MQSVLRLLIFFVVLRIDNARHVPLECEVCNATWRLCSSPKQRCPVNKDVCAVTYTVEYMDIGPFVATAKSCESKNICNSPIIEMYVQEGFYKKILVCCRGDYCRNPFAYPEMPKYNGKRCPSCYSIETKCHERRMDCVGENRYCFQMDVYLQFYVNSRGFNITVKGCTTKHVCGLLAAGQSPIWSHYSTLLNGKCELGHSKELNSASCSVASIFWLLLLKIFLSV